VFAAGETEGRNPRGALVDEDDDEEQVQQRGGDGVVRAAARGGYWFACSNSVPAGVIMICVDAG
jgi:hypothetical protein